MEELKQAAELGTRAEAYQKEGNFEFAKKCYLKIAVLLTEASKKAKSKESSEQVLEKVKKYTDLANAMQEKENNKIKVVPLRSTFPFPIKPVIKQQPKSHFNKMVSTEHRKPVFHNGKKTNNIDPDIENLLVKDIKVSFKDVSGMEEVKSTLEEAVIRPRKRPDLYQGIRAPPKGILLYGPPGNGKTFICKALANEAGCTFFALSASSIMNKFVGESEKMLKKIFKAAEQMSPSIIFIDEIDSILTSRSQNENQASRRLKTEFLVLLDGITSPKSGQVLVIGATNLPKQLDLAAKRRFNKLIYVGMPDKEAREDMVLRDLKQIPYDLSKSDLSKIVNKLEGYSASQIRDIVKQACMIPLRQLKGSQFQKISTNNIRKIGLKDFIQILQERKPLLSKEDLAKYKDKS